MSGVAFAGDGRLVSVADDGAVVAYAVPPYALALEEQVQQDKLNKYCEDKGALERKMRADKFDTELAAARAEFA